MSATPAFIAVSSFTPPASALRPRPLDQLRPVSNLHPPPSPSSAAQTRAASDDFFRSVAESIHRKREVASRSAPRPPPATDLHILTTAHDFLPPYRAKVVAVTPLTSHNDYVQLTIDISAANLPAAHEHPGQTIHLSRVPSSSSSSSSASKNRPAAVQAVIASPPHSGPHLDFLLSRAADPARLCSLRPGDNVAVGLISGPALSVDAHLAARADLFLFVDSPQGFAVARSLIECESFRAMSGSGANRTSSVTLFYTLPSLRSIPYFDRFSKWSVYGVNVVPVDVKPNTTLSYLAGRTSLLGIGTDTDAVRNGAAIVVSRSNTDFNAIFSHLVRLGVRRTAVDRFSADDLAAGGQETRKRMPTRPYSSSSSSASSYSYSYSPSSSSAASSPQSNFDGSPPRKRAGQPRGVPDDIYEDMMRKELEREIWAEWVALRNAMGQELWQELDVRRRQQKSANQAAEVERMAWEGWTMRNRNQWESKAWDGEAWQSYWQSWGAPKDEQAATGSGSYDSAYRADTQWNQNDSQEYWDWVGRGAGRGNSASGSGRSSTGSGGGGGGSQGYSSYSNQYAGYKSWGNTGNRQWSGYQKSGYKYQYEEPEGDRQKQQQGGGGNGWWQDWKSGKKWGNNSQQSSSSGSGSNQWYNQWSNRGGGGSGGGRYGQTRRQGDNLDLYGILGISSTASRADIKKAYRKKAMDHHPDRNPDTKEEATVMMKKIVVAWTVLKDDGRRRTYDQTGVAGM